MAVLLELLGMLIAVGFGYGFGLAAGRERERRRITALLHHEARMVSGTDTAVALESLAESLDEGR